MAIAQLNLAKAKWPLTDPQMSGFTQHLDRINQLADDSPGFIWRFIDDETNTLTRQTLSEPLLIANLSVWQSIEHLKHFVYQSEHREYLNNRSQWFESLPIASLVLWQHQQHQPPSLEQGMAKLHRFRTHGNSEKAFNFGYAMKLAKQGKI